MSKMPNKEALEILLGALTDAEWSQLKHLRETRSAHSITNMVIARKTSAVQFADWILKHTVAPGYDENGWACWVIADGTGRRFTSEELYNEYINGLFEPEEDDQED
jgi:hypothetical protein